MIYINIDDEMKALYALNDTSLTSASLSVRPAIFSFSTILSGGHAQVFYRAEY